MLNGSYLLCCISQIIIIKIFSGRLDIDPGPFFNPSARSGLKGHWLNVLPSLSRCFSGNSPFTASAPFHRLIQTSTRFDVEWFITKNPLICLLTSTSHLRYPSPILHPSVPTIMHFQINWYVLHYVIYMRLSRPFCDPYCSPTLFVFSYLQINLSFLIHSTAQKWA